MQQTVIPSPAVRPARPSVPDAVMLDRPPITDLQSAARTAPIHDMLVDGDVSPKERRVPFLVSISILLIVSIGIWAGLIWLVMRFLD